MKLRYLQTVWKTFAEDPGAPAVLVVKEVPGRVGAFDIWASGAMEAAVVSTAEGIDWRVHPITADKARSWLVANGFGAARSESAGTRWVSPGGRDSRVCADGSEDDAEFLAWALDQVLRGRPWYGRRDATAEDLAEL